MTLRAVFIDRDGVINRAYIREGKPYPPADLSQLQILPGVAEALIALKKKGFMLIVVTNQPDVARKTQSRETVEAMNRHLSAELCLDEFRTCYHDSEDHCDCRKPKPGMLLAAALAHGVDLSSSYMVGDRWRDIEAGRQAGCKTLFIDQAYDEKSPKAYDYRVKSLAEAANIILSANDSSVI